MPKSIRLISWNVNGIRAAEKKGFLDWLAKEKPDVVCLQETKAHPDQLSPALLHPPGYEATWNAAERKGYSGTVTYTRKAPVLCETNFGDRFLDGEGRIVLTEFEKFFLFNVYFPNGGSGEDRLQFKLEFYKRFLELAQSFRKQKPVIVCGDVNTAHTELDLARPKENEERSGFMPIERAWVDRFIKTGYIDTFRLFHEGNGHYSWWDLKTASRERNVGWRIDYFFVSGELKGNVKSARILADVFGSDHCPVELVISV